MDEEKKLYEYRIICNEVDNLSQTTKQINELASNGFRVISVNQYAGKMYWTLEREKK